MAVSAIQSMFVDFNPRSPWGERRDGIADLAFKAAFQSTLPVGGATITFGGADPRAKFQSTLPVGGATARMHKFPAASLAKTSNLSGTTPEKLCQTGSKQVASSQIPEKSRANLPGFSVHLRFALQNQGILREIGVLAAEMLNFLFVLIPQIVETEAVLFRIHDGQKLCL